MSLGCAIVLGLEGAGCVAVVSPGWVVFGVTVVGVVFGWGIKGFSGGPYHRLWLLIAL